MKQDFVLKIQEIIANQSTDERELLLQLKTLLYETEEQHIIVKESKSITELVAENLTQLNGASHEGQIIKTGFAEFDKKFGGFGLGEFVVIGGRPSMGKTQLLINLSLNISLTIPVLYFTFDLSEFLLTNRFISSCSSIPVNKILQHNLSENEQQVLASIGTEFSKHKIFINDSYKSSLTAFKAQCKKQVEENGVQVIVVDCLQMMSSNRYRNSREHEIGQISGALKSIAKDLNVCLIASSQLSRAVESRKESKRPQLPDLRESGAIEQDADKVIFIYRPDYYELLADEFGNSTAGLTEIVLAKNRNGSLGTINLIRDAHFTNFKDFEDYKNDFSFSKNRLDEIDTPF